MKIRLLIFFLLAAVFPVELTAQEGFVYTTDGTRTFSLTRTDITGSKDDNIHSAIVLKPSETYQSIDGFGFAITYSSCYNLLKMSKEDRTQLLTKTFSPTEGYGVSYVRISIGCNDFSSTEYSLCDEKGPQDDLLRHFRLYTDETDYVIPVLKEILAINPDLKIIGSPWTCPRWMKVRSLDNLTAHNSWTDGHLSPSYYKTYADYFVRFIEAMAAEGINIYAVTPQNEPLNPGNCASLYMPWNEEAGFVKRMATAFKQAGLSTKIYLFDHNYNYDGKESEQQYPAKIYKLYENTEFEGKELVVGAAYHNYGGNSDELNVIHDMYPDKELIFTEASIGTWNNGRNLDSSLADCMVNIGLHTMNKHCIGAIVWNFMLDMQRGPNLDGGCQTCYGAIDIADDYKSYTLNSHYYVICHLSAVVRPGACRIATEGWWYNGVTYTAYRNPDGTLAVVFYNANHRQLKVNITDGENRYDQVSLPPRAAISVLMNNNGGTGLQSLRAASPSKDAECYYTLAGVRTSTPTTPGIYICQGKKSNNKEIVRR